EWMAEMGQSGRVKVSVVGKIKTIAQMVALLLMIYHQDLWFLPLGAIGLWLLYAAAVLTLWSLVQYLKIALPQLIQYNAGPRPVIRPARAGIAQLVERNLATLEVASSSLVSRYIFFRPPGNPGF